MEWYDCTDPEELVLIATAMAIGISKNLTSNQINSLGNFFEMVGQNLLTIAAQRVLYENKCLENISDEEAEDNLFRIRMVYKTDTNEQVFTNMAKYLFYL